MKVIILAGGTKSTISDNNEGIPKPMAEIGEKPILWHIMKNFSARGFKEFIVCGGYQVNMIKDYFTDFYIFQSDITVDLQNNTIKIHKKKTEEWKVTVVDTGLNTLPGERILQVQEYVGQEDFIVVHGDCLSDINYNELISRHKYNDKVATITVAKPTGRNAILPILHDGLLMQDEVALLPENQAWVNACCYIFTNKIFSYMSHNFHLEKDLFSVLAKDERIISYLHNGFWTPIETKRDRAALEDMWNKNIAPWKIWN